MMNAFAPQPLHAIRIRQNQIHMRQQLPVAMPEQIPIGSQSDHGDGCVPQAGRNSSVVQIEDKEVRLPNAGESLKDGLPRIPFRDEEGKSAKRVKRQALAGRAMLAQVPIHEAIGDWAEQIFQSHTITS
jgi:hypothetical protein